MGCGDHPGESFVKLLKVREGLASDFLCLLFTLLWRGIVSRLRSAARGES